MTTNLKTLSKLLTRQEMIDLTSISSLPIAYDMNCSAFKFTEEIKCRKLRTISLKKLIPALLNKSLKYPENVYEENIDLFFSDDRDFFNCANLHYEILVLPAGLLGIEFIKSHVYFTQSDKGKTSCVVECLYGIMTVIIQKNAPKEGFDFDTEVEEGIMVKVRRGEKIEIPSGYYYTFINTRNTPVIFSRLFKEKGIVDYTTLEREQGLAYFAIRKNARAEIVYNPRYKNIPALIKFTPSDERFTCKCGKLSLYQAVKKNANYFLEKLNYTV